MTSPREMSRRPSQSVDSNLADPSWKNLYIVGGVSALLYVILSLVVPAIMVFSAGYEFNMDGAVFVEYVSAHKVWWLLLQTGVIGSSVLAIIAFVALFIALMPVDKSFALLGATVTILIQILFIAYYPVLLGMVYLSDRYAAADGAERMVVVSAAEALIAQNNAFNPLYEAVFGVGILLFSLAMLKGVFSKPVAYLGIANAPAALISLALWPVIGVAYFWWWVLFIVWFIAVGWKLIRLGRA